MIDYRNGKLFTEGVARIRQEEQKIQQFTKTDFLNNQRKVQEIVCKIINDQA